MARKPGSKELPTPAQQGAMAGILSTDLPPIAAQLMDEGPSQSVFEQIAGLSTRLEEELGLADWQQEERKKQLAAQMHANAPFGSPAPMQLVKQFENRPSMTQFYEGLGVSQGFGKTALKVSVRETLAAFPRIATNTADLIEKWRGSPDKATNTKDMMDWFNDQLSMNPNSDLPTSTAGTIVGTIVGFLLPAMGIAKLVGRTTGFLNATQWAKEHPFLVRGVQHIVEGGVQEMTTAEPNAYAWGAFASFDMLIRNRGLADWAARRMRPGKYSKVGPVTSFWDAYEMRWFRESEVIKMRGLSPDTAGTAYAWLRALANASDMSVEEHATATMRPLILEAFDHSAGEGLLSGKILRRPQPGETPSITFEGGRKVDLSKQRGLLEAMDHILWGHKMTEVVATPHVATKLRKYFRLQHPSEYAALMNQALADAAHPAYTTSVKTLSATITDPATGKSMLVPLGAKLSSQLSQNLQEGMRTKTLVLSEFHIPKDMSLAEAHTQMTDFMQTVFGKRFNGDLPGVFIDEAVDSARPYAVFRLPKIEGVRGTSVAVQVSLDATTGEVAEETLEKLAQEGAVLIEMMVPNITDAAYRVRAAKALQAFAPKPGSIAINTEQIRRYASAFNQAFGGQSASRSASRSMDLPNSNPPTPPAQTFEIVKQGFRQEIPGVIDGHRAGAMNVTNAAPGAPGALGNPFVAVDAGGRLTRKEAVEKFREAFLKRMESDPEYRAWIETLRGKKIGYYKPDEPDIHLKVIQEWLAANPPTSTAQMDIPRDVLKADPADDVAVASILDGLVRGEPDAEAIYHGLTKDTQAKLKEMAYRRGVPDGFRFPDEVRSKLPETRPEAELTELAHRIHEGKITHAEWIKMQGELHPQDRATIQSVVDQLLIVRPETRAEIPVVPGDLDSKLRPPTINQIYEGVVEDVARNSGESVDTVRRVIEQARFAPHLLTDYDKALIKAGVIPRIDKWLDAAVPKEARAALGDMLTKRSSLLDQLRDAVINDGMPIDEYVFRSVFLREAPDALVDDVSLSFQTVRGFREAISGNVDNVTRRVMMGGFHPEYVEMVGQDGKVYVRQVIKITPTKGGYDLTYRGTNGKSAIVNVTPDSAKRIRLLGQRRSAQAMLDVSESLEPDGQIRTVYQILSQSGSNPISMVHEFGHMTLGLLKEDSARELAELLAKLVSRTPTVPTGRLSELATSATDEVLTAEVQNFLRGIREKLLTDGQITHLVRGKDDVLANRTFTLDSRLKGKAREDNATELAWRIFLQSEDYVPVMQRLGLKEIPADAAETITIDEISKTMQLGDIGFRAISNDPVEILATEIGLRLAAAARLHNMDAGVVGSRTLMREWRKTLSMPFANESTETRAAAMKLYEFMQEAVKAMRAQLGGDSVENRQLSAAIDRILDTAFNGARDIADSPISAMQNIESIIRKTFTEHVAKATQHTTASTAADYVFGRTMNAIGANIVGTLRTTGVNMRIATLYRGRTTLVEAVPSATKAGQAVVWRLTFHNTGALSSERSALYAIDHLTAPFTSTGKWTVSLDDIVMNIDTDRSFLGQRLSQEVVLVSKTGERLRTGIYASISPRSDRNLIMFGNEYLYNVIGRRSLGAMVEIRSTAPVKRTRFIESEAARDPIRAAKRKLKKNLTPEPATTIPVTEARQLDSPLYQPGTFEDRHYPAMLSNGRKIAEGMRAQIEHNARCVRYENPEWFLDADGTLAAESRELAGLDRPMRRIGFFMDSPNDVPRVDIEDLLDQGLGKSGVKNKHNKRARRAVYDILIGHENAARDPEQLERFVHRLSAGTSGEIGPGLTVHIVPRLTETGAARRKWRVTRENSANIDLHPDFRLGQLYDQVIQSVEDISDVQVFSPGEALFLLGRRMKRGGGIEGGRNYGRILLDDKSATNYTWILRDVAGTSGEGELRTVITPTLLQRGGQDVAEVTLDGHIPKDIQTLLELGYEVQAIAGNLPAEAGLAKKIHNIIRVNTKRVTGINQTLTGAHLEKLSQLAARAGYYMRLSPNGIKLIAVDSTSTIKTKVYNSLEELRAALNVPAEDVLLPGSQSDLLAPLINRVLTNAQDLFPNLDHLDVEAHSLKDRFLSTLREAPKEWRKSLKGIQSFGMYAASPMPYLTARLQKMTGLPIWDFYDAMTHGHRKVESAVEEDLKEIAELIGRHSDTEQRIITHALEFGVGRPDATLSEAERALRQEFWQTHGHHITDEVRETVEAVRKWYEKMFSTVVETQGRHAPYLDLYAPHRFKEAEAKALQMAQQGVKADTDELRALANPWFLKQRGASGMQGELDDRIGALVLKYARSARRFEHLGPVSAQMVELITRLRAEIGDSAQISHKWMALSVLTHLQNEITQQMGPTTTKIYQMVYTTLRHLGFTDKAAAEFPAALLQWGYFSGLGFRSGAAIRNMLYAPVPIYSMLGGKHLQEGARRMMELRSAGVHSQYARYMDKKWVDFGGLQFDPDRGIAGALTGSSRSKMRKLMTAAMWMQAKTEEIGRTWAYMSGISSAEDVIARKASGISDELLIEHTPLKLLEEPERRKLLGILEQEGAEEFKKAYGAAVVRFTQYSYGPGQSFMAANNRLGKFLFFYGTWASNNAMMVGRIIRHGFTKDGKITGLNILGSKPLLRYILATGAGWSALNALGINANSTFTFGPGAYTGSPYLQLATDAYQTLREPSNKKGRSIELFLRRLEKTMMPAGSALQDVTKGAEDLYEGHPYNALIHIIMGSYPTSESKLMNKGKAVHKWQGPLNLSGRYRQYRDAKERLLSYLDPDPEENP